MTDIEYYEKMRNLLRVAGDHLAWRGRNRLIHETQKRLAIAYHDTHEEDPRRRSPKNNPPPPIDEKGEQNGN